MSTDHRWNTKEYEERTRQLYRTELYKLYPSESWALYRILPKCETILDLGCGNGAMAAITKQIAPNARYTGMDHNADLMSQAQKDFPYAKFETGNLSSYIKSANKHDCVMSWSVIKSFENWRDVISSMVKKANRFVICDIRVANTNFEAFDDQICWADYGGRRGPIAFLSYSVFRDELMKSANQLSRIELVAYQSEWGKFVHLKEGIDPETFLVVCVLHKKLKDSEPTEGFEIFERLPSNLER